MEFENMYLNYDFFLRHWDETLPSASTLRGTDEAYCVVEMFTRSTFIPWWIAEVELTDIT